MSWLPYVLTIWLFMVGLYGIVTSRNFIHLTNCLAVAQAAVFVLFLAIGYRSEAAAPIFQTISPETPAVDPVVQALMLTAIVVGAVVQALILALAIQAQKRFNTLDPTELRGIEG